VEVWGGGGGGGGECGGAVGCVVSGGQCFVETP